MEEFKNYHKLVLTKDKNFTSLSELIRMNHIHSPRSLIAQEICTLKNEAPTIVEDD